MNHERKMSTFDRLFVEILQRAFPEPNPPHDAKEFLERHERSLKAAGRIFEYLAMVEPDKQSQLAWKPSSRFIEHIARRATTPLRASKGTESDTDTAIVNLLLDVADVPLDSRGTVEGFFVQHLLTNLGLIRDTSRGASKPTRMLTRLIVARDYPELSLD
jgi:hypothetical protein